MDVELPESIAIGLGVAVYLAKSFGFQLPQFKRNGNGNGNGSYATNGKVIGFSTDDTKRQVENWAFEAPRVANGIQKVAEKQIEVLECMRETLTEMKANEDARDRYRRGGP